MPFGMLGILLIPLGLGGPCFVLMGHGIEVIIQAAALMAELPGAALAVPRPPLAALVATALGALWLCLWRTAWRRLGLLGIALGLLLMPLGQPPDLLIDAPRRDRRGPPRRRPRSRSPPGGAIAGSPTTGCRAPVGRRPRPGRPRAWPQAALACDPLGCVARAPRPPRRARAPARGARGGLPRGRPRDQLPAPRALPDRHAADRPAARCATLAASRSGSGPRGLATLTVREVRGDRPWTAEQ